MAPTEMANFFADNKRLVEEQLSHLIKSLSAPETLKESMNYSLEAGGKRIRPLLLFAALKAFNKDVEIGVPAAAAIEMIHTYSLIHDDLPSMDDDDLRRGKPTNHKVYGEAMAILAGDGLLTYSFQVIAEMKHETVTAEQKIKLVSLLAKAAGPEGMVGGQVADMEGEGRSLTLSELEYIHKHKTGKMLVYSVLAGAILGGADEQQLDILEKFADNLGLAFQIRDDILDIEGNEEKIGKRVGSDIANHKNTYPSLLTMDGAKEKLAEHIQIAKDSLKSLALDTGFLGAVCDLVASRDH